MIYGFLPASGAISSAGLTGKATYAKKSVPPGYQMINTILQRRHIVAERHVCCGKEFKRKLEQGPIDHELDVRCKVYVNGRVQAGPEILRQLAAFSEREIANGTGLQRKPIRFFRHGGTVTWKTYEKIQSFLRACRSSGRLP